jgi:hypothetical protein
MARGTATLAGAATAGGGHPRTFFLRSGAIATREVSRAPRILVAMNASSALVRTQFTLSAPGRLDFAVTVRLARFGDRWLAVAEIADEPEVGLGRTARQALEAALASLGDHAARALLADTALLQASLDILGQEPAAAG